MPINFEIKSILFDDLKVIVRIKSWFFFYLLLIKIVCLCLIYFKMCIYITRIDFNGIIKLIKLLYGLLVT